MRNVYLNNISSFFPNAPVGNEEMEDYIGLIGGKPSRVRSIMLRHNGIKTQYYGLDREHKITHFNAQFAKEAVIGLFEDKTIPTDVTLLVCGTSTLEQLFPFYATMVHGEYRNFNDELLSRGAALTKEKWFVNLTSVGDVCPAATFVALDELIKTKDIKRGSQILLLVPESGRSSYETLLLSCL